MGIVSNHKYNRLVFILNLAQDNKMSLQSSTISNNFSHYLKTATCVSTKWCTANLIKHCKLNLNRSWFNLNSSRKLKKEFTQQRLKKPLISPIYLKLRAQPRLKANRLRISHNRHHNQNKNSSLKFQSFVDSISKCFCLPASTLLPRILLVRSKYIRDLKLEVHSEIIFLEAWAHSQLKLKL